MKLHRFLQITKSWTRKSKHIRVLERKERQPPLPTVNKTSPHDSSSNTSSEQLHSSETLSDSSFLEPEALLSEMPFYGEELLPSGNDAEVITREFTRFPNLPAELQIKIWTHVCFIPRNCEVKSWNYGRRIAIPTLDSHEENPWQVWIYRSNTIPPAVLSVSSQSREVGLKYYALDWGTHYAFRGFTFSTPATIYVNWDVDRIVMSQRFHSKDIEDCVDFFDRCFRKARSVALNVKDKGRLDECEYIRPFLHKVMENQSNTPLREIILFGEEHSTNWPGKRLVFKTPPIKWLKSNDCCLLVLKGTRHWVKTNLSGVKETPLKIYYKQLSEKPGRY